MQPGNEVSGNVAPEYPRPTPISSDSKSYSIARKFMAVVLAWLVPGAGHLALGRAGRALIFFIAIAGSFAFGLMLQGRLFWPVVADPPGTLHYDLISVLWWFAQMGSGLCYLAAYGLDIGTTPNPAATTYDYGNTFMFLAGLLNYLVVHDAVDIASGRKR